MKTLVAAVALTALIATPVFAQTNKRTHGPRAQTQQTSPQARSTHPTNTNNVYDSSGRYLGSDPDATVRGMLLYDQGSQD